MGLSNRGEASRGSGLGRTRMGREQPPPHSWVALQLTKAAGAPRYLARRLQKRLTNDANYSDRTRSAPDQPDSAKRTPRNGVARKRGRRRLLGFSIQIRRGSHKITGRYSD